LKHEIIHVLFINKPPIKSLFIAPLCAETGYSSLEFREYRWVTGPAGRERVRGFIEVNSNTRMPVYIVIDRRRRLAQLVRREVINKLHLLIVTL